MKDLIIAKGDRLVACRQCDEPIMALHKARFCDPKRYATKCSVRFHNRPQQLEKRRLKSLLKSVSEGR
jgi:hypothetical protein